MSTLRAITVRLDAEDCARLESEAEHLGVPPATLVRIYVRARLNGDDAQVGRRSGMQALDRLRELTADLPIVDAVQIAQENRESLDARQRLKWRSSLMLVCSWCWSAAIDEIHAPALLPYEVANG